MTLPKVLIFDINETLLDMDEMKQGLAPVLNGDETLVDLWFATLLHHSLVDIASGQFHDFIDIGAAALVMVAHSKDIEISQSDAKHTIKKYITALPPHADVKPALNALKDKGFTLVALSNSSINGLAEQLRFANIKDCFDHILSTEAIHTYKPHASVYHWACNHVSALPSEVMMVAAHGWDVSGAKAAGLQTTFIERPGKTMYPLGLTPDYVLSTLTELANTLTSEC